MALENNQDYIPLSDLAKDTPYSQEYLSLLARKNKIPAKKIGRSWCSTKQAVENYVQEQAQFYQSDQMYSPWTKKQKILFFGGLALLIILVFWILNSYFYTSSPAVVLPQETQQPDFSIHVDEKTNPPMIYVLPE